MDRRTELTEAALDYVLEHGLIGLSLRPLAAALGTSDRMLIYHFGSKDQLITAVVVLANGRMSTALAEGATELADAGELVRHAWARLGSAEPGRLTRLYLELCVLSARDPLRWAEAQQQLRGPWIAMLSAALSELSVPAARVPALAQLLLDGIDGLLLHRLTGADPAEADAAAAAFADLFAGAHRPA